MALNLARETKNTGISPTYWRVSNVSVQRHTNGTSLIHIQIEGWIDEPARRNEKSPAVVESFRVVALAPGADLAEQAYESLKLLPEWSAATDL